MEERHIGVIDHYYPKAHAAVVDLQDGAIRIGDRVHITGKGIDFTETVRSLQMDHKSVKQGKRGQKIGLEVKEPVKENIDVFRVEDT